MTDTATTEATDRPLKIVSLQAENLKRLVAVRIDPTGNLVEITGRNAQGKTSVLDSIWWALAGAGVIQKSPIRKGQQSAKVTLDLGELIVTRTFQRLEGEEFTTSVAVKTADGVRVSSPQRVLDAMVGAIALDPLEFARMAPKDQFDTLRRFVPGVDFAAIEKANKEDRERRADVNRRARDAKTRAEAISIPASVPGEKVDESALVDELGEVGAFNAELERRAERREKAAADAKTRRDAAAENRSRAARLRAEADEAEEHAKAHDTAAADLEEKLASAEPLPAPKDPADVRRRLEEAKRVNLAVEQSTRRRELRAEAEALEAEAEGITRRIADREEAKRQAVASAELPVPGVGFAEEAITLNGVPFEQASDAEKLRASCAIAMASNPRLRVIRVRDGSLLDEDGLRILADMADAADCQVWVERVDSSGRVGFVIENGEVRHVPEAPAKAAE